MTPEERISDNYKTVHAYREPCARLHTDGVHQQGDTTEVLPVATIQDREDDKFLYGVVLAIIVSIPWWIGMYYLLHDFILWCSK